MTPIQAALDTLRPQLAADFERRARNVFEAVVKEFGPALQGIYNSSWIHSYNTFLRDSVEHAGTRISSPAFLNDEKLKAVADRKAHLSAQAWREKIEAKLQNVTDVEIVSHHGCRFAISGQRNGHKVFIEQDMIVNVSSRGTLFNQFPARLYLDGKKVSEKAYKDFFKGA